MSLPSRVEIMRLFEETQKQLGSSCNASEISAPVFEYLLGQSREGIARYAYSMARYKIREKFWQLRHPVNTLLKRPLVRTEDLLEFGVFEQGMVPLLDLAAFPITQLRKGTLSLDRLKHLGVDQVVLMEDRNPLFFLNFAKRKDLMVIPLAKQFCAFDQDVVPWMADDLDLLIGALHSAGIRVLLGFWGYIDDNAYNPFIHSNRDALCPVIPGSSDLNPLSNVTVRGELMSFPDYVVRQYHQIVEEFPFDGLFLGDGMMGYRNFLTPHEIGDYTVSIPAWEMCYQILAEGVRGAGGELWAFDVMGRTYVEAHKSGIEYARMMPHLDRLVVQTYGGVAWNSYMHIPGYTLERDLHVLHTIQEGVRPADREKITVTLEIGDSVEGWRVTKKHMEMQVRTLGGKAHSWLGVWSNDWVRRLFV